MLKDAQRIWTANLQDYSEESSLIKDMEKAAQGDWVYCKVFQAGVLFMLTTFSYPGTQGYMHWYPLFIC